jgi:hypothetical protein
MKEAQLWLPTLRRDVHQSDALDACEEKEEGGGFLLEGVEQGLHVLLAVRRLAQLARRLAQREPEQRAGETAIILEEVSTQQIFLIMNKASCQHFIQR